MTADSIKDPATSSGSEEDETVGSQQTQIGQLDSAQTLIFDADEQFHDLYDRGLSCTGTPDRGDKRRQRFFNLIQMLRSTTELRGDVIECGCWKGLSAFLMCNYLRIAIGRYSGRGFHIVDSFQGLSEPGPEDVIERDLVCKGRQRKGASFKPSGSYAADLSSVQQALADFPSVAYHAGWIPEVLQTLPERRYRFVHIDLDLYEPTLSCLEYFYPRMVYGGILVCDDYGSLFWPGARRAFDEFSQRIGGRGFGISTGQGVIVRDGHPSGLLGGFPGWFRLAMRRWMG